MTDGADNSIALKDGDRAAPPARRGIMSCPLRRSW